MFWKREVSGIKEEVGRALGPRHPLKGVYGTLGPIGNVLRTGITKSFPLLNSQCLSILETLAAGSYKHTGFVCERVTFQAWNISPVLF